MEYSQKELYSHIKYCYNRKRFLRVALIIKESAKYPQIRHGCNHVLYHCKSRFKIR